MNVVFSSLEVCDKTKFIYIKMKRKSSINKVIKTKVTNTGLKIVIVYSLYAIKKEVSDRSENRKKEKKN